MNKTIGLLNFHYSDHNYGAVLQAAALADVISRLGYSVEHIDFIPKKIEQTTHAIGFLFLIGLMLLVTYFDILKLLA